MNKYDLNHVCTRHPKMSRDQWNEAYRMAWQRYYTDEHIETILKGASRLSARTPRTRCS